MAENLGVKQYEIKGGKTSMGYLSPQMAAEINEIKRHVKESTAFLPINTNEKAKRYLALAKLHGHNMKVIRENKLNKIKNSIDES